MIPATIRHDEAERLAALERLAILDTPAEERFDRITRIAQRSFGVNIAAINMVDGERQWAKAAQGMDEIEHPREASFCAYTVSQNAPFIVENAEDDIRFCDNPFVTGDPPVRFYAGYPVRTPDGYPVGTLCLADDTPRMLSGRDMALLRDLAALVERELQATWLSQSQAELIHALSAAERQSRIDSLTRLWNRMGITELLERTFDNAMTSESPLSIAMVDLDRFHRVNEAHGYEAGDALLEGVAATLRGTLRPADLLGRWGGDTFLVIFPETDALTAARLAEGLREAVAESCLEDKGATICPTCTLGLTATTLISERSVGALIQDAETNMRQGKTNGRNQVMPSWDDLMEHGLGV